MCPMTPELSQRFATALAHVEERFDESERGKLLDERTNDEVRRWLDAQDEPLPWSGTGVTPDEWFFITTLYGEMTLNRQRTHIRKFFPLFVHAATRDIRSFTSELVAGWPLRSGWMKGRLCKMAELLRQRGISMQDYTKQLRRLEAAARPEDPMPALDAIVRDHQATGWKTLSCFVRDCVRGNCFPIDSRVATLLAKHDLPADERLLVSMCLAFGRSPRPVARMFYAAGGH